MSDYIDPTNQPIPEHVLRMLPGQVARSENALPIAYDGEVLTIAVDELDDYDFDKVDKLRFVSNRVVRLVSAPRVRLRYAIWRYYG